MNFRNRRKVECQRTSSEDSVSKQNEISSKYTICLANPPFKGTIDAESINDNLKADGFSLDDKRSEISENDIPDIIDRFYHLENEKNRERTEQSFFVPKQEIIDNDYDLSINKYKKIEYIPVEYPPTEEILGEIDRLEQEIQSELAELKKLLV